jgi:hypothetical protein
LIDHSWNSVHGEASTYTAPQLLRLCQAVGIWVVIITDQIAALRSWSSYCCKRLTSSDYLQPAPQVGSPRLPAAGSYAMIEVFGDEAGMHVSVMLQNGGRDLEISERAARQNLSLWPLSPSYLGKASHQGFILGFGGTTMSEIPTAVRKLRHLLAGKRKSSSCGTWPW